MDQTPLSFCFADGETYADTGDKRNGGAWCESLYLQMETQKLNPWSFPWKWKENLFQGKGMFFLFILYLYYSDKHFDTFYDNAWCD